MKHYTNGSGSATRVITGVSLAHRSLTKEQRAVIAAEVLDGNLSFAPTQAQMAGSAGVCVGYVARARKLPAEKRAAILAGTARGLLAPPPKLLALPKPNGGNGISDEMLTELVRAAGTERVFQAIEREL
jgi:hypothetical protein